VFEAVELARLTCGFNNRRLLEPIGDIPPNEAEERYSFCSTAESHSVT
jgi:hypothetical protein